METLNSPEIFQDWDADDDLDVNGHAEKWKQVLIEMLAMTILQFISNFMLLVPFFITGKHYT